MTDWAKLLAKWHRVSTPYPSDTLLCFLWKLVVCQDFSAGKICHPAEISWLTKLHWAKSAWRSLPKIAGTSATKVKSWIRYSLHCFQNYCMFKTSTKKERKNYAKDIYYSNQFLPISMVYCSKSSKQVLTFTKFKP